MSSESWKRLQERLHSDPVALAARDENNLRRRLSVVIAKEQRERGLSIRAFAKAAGTSLSQIQRILSVESGGSLTLLTVFKVANALGLEVDLVLRRASRHREEARSSHTHAWGKCSQPTHGAWAKVIFPPAFGRTTSRNDRQESSDVPACIGG
jgi:transcriptional regulator with XRE-family HTH domain